jgi:dihydroorotase
MKNLLIKNGRVIDPANNRDEVVDILVEKGVIAKIGANLPENGAQVIDATGKIVMPGMIDLHVHLREPGREDKETVATGTRAALKGGVTTVVAMPNTNPVMDGVGPVRLLKGIVAKTANARVLMAAALTKGQAGVEVVDVGALKADGVVALTDDGVSVDSEDVMREVLLKAKAADLVVLSHAEDRTLAAGGVAHLGFQSTALGLRGIPRDSEFERVRRDVALAAETGARLHIMHVSCRETVEAVRDAKKKGLCVTAEATPHHFSLTDEALVDYDSNFKMNPPLRESDDVLAVLEGLKDGTIDAIASDHAPHTENEKEIEFDRAAFGVIGLETTLGVAVTWLIEKKILSWSALVERCASGPARVLKSDLGTLGVGRTADVVIVDPDKTWTVTDPDFASKSGNCAFLGRVLKGCVLMTILGGVVAYKRNGKT